MLNPICITLGKYLVLWGFAWQKALEVFRVYSVSHTEGTRLEVSAIPDLIIQSGEAGCHRQCKNDH